MISLGCRITSVIPTGLWSIYKFQSLINEEIKLLAFCTKRFSESTKEGGGYTTGMQSADKTIY